MNEMSTCSKDQKNVNKGVQNTCKTIPAVLFRRVEGNAFHVITGDKVFGMEYILMSLYIVSRYLIFVLTSCCLSVLMTHVPAISTVESPCLKHNTYI